MSFLSRWLNIEQRPLRLTDNAQFLLHAIHKATHNTSGKGITYIELAKEAHLPPKILAETIFELASNGLLVVTGSPAVSWRFRFMPVDVFVEAANDFTNRQAPFKAGKAFLYPFIEFLETSTPRMRALGLTCLHLSADALDYCNNSNGKLLSRRDMSLLF